MSYYKPNRLWKHIGCLNQPELIHQVFATGQVFAIEKHRNPRLLCTDLRAHRKTIVLSRPL